MAAAVIEDEYDADQVAELRVGGSSDTKAVAAAIDISLTQGKIVVIRVIGAAALNQAIKAVAIVRGQRLRKHSDVYMRPSFVTVNIKDDAVSALELIVGLG